MGLAVGEGVAVGRRVALAVGVVVDRKVAVGVAEVKAVAVDMTVGSTVSGARADSTTCLSPASGKMVGWPGPAHPHARSMTSTHPKRIRTSIDPDALRVTILLFDFLCGRNIPPTG